MSNEFEAFLHTVGAQMEAVLTDKESIDLMAWPLTEPEQDTLNRPARSPVNWQQPVRVQLENTLQTLQASCDVSGFFVAHPETPYYHLFFRMLNLPEYMGWGRLEIRYADQPAESILWILSSEASQCDAYIDLEPGTVAADPGMLSGLQLHCTLKDQAMFARLQAALQPSAQGEPTQTSVQPLHTEKISRRLAWVGLQGLREAAPVTRQIAAAGTPLPARELRVLSLLPDYQLIGLLGEDPDAEAGGPQGIALQEGQLSLRINQLPVGAQATYLLFEHNTWQRLQVPEAELAPFLFGLIGVMPPDPELAAYAENFEFERGPVAQKASPLAPLILNSTLNWHQADSLFILIWAAQETADA